MNEFLKLDWRIKDLKELESQQEFLTEDDAKDSLVLKLLEGKNVFAEKSDLKTNPFASEQYIPGAQFCKTTVRKSCLEKKQQEDCLKAMKALYSGKDPSHFSNVEKFCVKIYNQLKPKILEENSRYQTYAFQEYQRHKLKLVQMKPQIFSFGKQTWEKKCKRVLNYPQFYSEAMSFSMNYSENDGTIEFKHIGTALELGNVPKFMKPELTTKCLLQSVTLPFPKDKVFNSELPVSKDENITEIISKNNCIDIVISASALKCLVDNSDAKSKWFIPIIVKEINTEKNKKKNIVFIDKPCPPASTNKLELAMIGYKRLMKTNFCQYEGIEYPTKDNYADVEDDTCATGNLLKFKRKNNVVHHNAVYRIWNIKKFDDQCNMMKHKTQFEEINVLIRSKIDGCELTQEGTTLQPVIVRPKIERQLHLGANIVSKSELAREWASLFFCPYSVLYRIRLHLPLSEVYFAEKCTIQKVIAEAQIQHQYKPHLGLGILQKVFAQLMVLNPGNYLLQHLPKHEAFVALMKECDAEKPSKFDLHAEYKKITIMDLPKDWLPIDVNFILPAFESQGRMPGMFTPYVRRMGEKRKKQNKK